MADRWEYEYGLSGDCNYGPSPCSVEPEGDMDGDDRYPFDPRFSFGMDRDGMPTEWEWHNGLSDNDTYDAIEDVDFDGVNNLQEYLLGTDPTQAPNQAPAFTFDMPETVVVGAGELLHISWTDSDPDSNASIALYYTDNSIGSEGILVVDGLYEDDPNNNFHWDTTGLAYGIYTLYAVIDDGVNEAITQYADNTINIDIPNLYGSSGDTTLVGDEGVENIYGGSGDDNIEGDGGNDMLFGGTGADTYIYRSGDGSDTINNYDDVTPPEFRNDVLYVDESVDPNTVEITREGVDLIITLEATGDVIVVPFHFYRFDGNDRITNYQHDTPSYQRNDVFEFGEGIFPSDVSMEHVGYDLIFTVLPTDETVTIEFHNLNIIEGGATKRLSNRIKCGRKIKNRLFFGGHVHTHMWPSSSLLIVTQFYPAPIKLQHFKPSPLTEFITQANASVVSALSGKNFINNLLLGCDRMRRGIHYLTDTPTLPQFTVAVVLPGNNILGVHNVLFRMLLG